jgi:hypothetical protein
MTDAPVMAMDSTVHRHIGQCQQIFGQPGTHKTGNAGDEDTH